MTDSDHKLALQLGQQLDEYRLVRVLGAGGFGVTYLAEHIQAGNRVAIKEYLPNELAVREGDTVHPKSAADREGFAWGLARFLDEARTLARFEHRNVVRVQRYFEANNTAYLVMDYEDGASLGELLKEHGTLSEAQLRRVLMPIVDGLRAVHAAGFLHRDIKPDNIFVRRSDESPVLLDFGAARQALGHRSRSLTGVITAGYSPPEQYESDGNQGPWTDVYALSALCSKAITGTTPVDVLDRQREVFRHRRADPLPRLADNPPEGYSRSFLEAVDWGLRLSEEDRPQTLDEWVARLESPAASTSDRVAPRPDDRRRESKPASKGRAAGIGVAVAAVAAVVSAGVWFWSQSPEAPARSERGVAPGVPGPEPAREAVDVSSLTGGNAILVVETEPPGAEVMLGDAVAGTTPLQLRDVLAGTYSVTLRHPHYETVLVENQTFADGEVLRIERTLVGATGKLTVLTEPADAWVVRDGERLARGTPVTLDGLPAGPLELTLGAVEHETIRVAVDIPKDGVGALERTLRRIPHGTLTLELDPPDATVTLPDVAPSYSPGMRLPEGEHRVTVRRAGYRERTQAVTVSGDTHTRIALELDPQPFTVETMPATATVELPDTDQAYRPGVPLPFGDYPIRVSAPEYETLQETVTHGTEPTRHAVDLVRLPQPFTVEVTPAEAVVDLVGTGVAYRAGMRLPAGEYRVQVSAEGYKPHEEALRHGTEPTRVSMTLERAIPGPGGTFAEKLASGGDGPEMVVIPPGVFRMGCVSSRDCEDSEHPVHEVRIASPFALSKHEVTVGGFARFVDATGHRTSDSCWTYEAGEWKDRSGWNWRSPGFGQTDGHPVVCVNWGDAVAYVAWLSRETGEAYRLPSESEWEYAARAGTTTKYHFGNEESGLCRYGNHADASSSFSWRNQGCSDGVGLGTAPVGSYGANGFGLHDVHGNVWEWTVDCWNDSYVGAPSDGRAWERGDCAKRVLRGGSWFNFPGFLRSAYRSRVAPGNRSGFSGFRVARTLTP